MDIFAELTKRDVIMKITNLEKANNFLLHKEWSLYVGFDPSFRSLHLGNYLMLVTLKRFIKHGYKVLALVGGATGQIGDPSGKKNERQLLNKNVIEENINSICKQIRLILNNVEIVNNDNFYKNVHFIDFLRNIGKHINVNYLLEKEIISTRLESGISYAEFSYNLIQANDFLQLYNTKNVVLQLGGSDQWGNITTGIELIRKCVGDKNDAFGVTLKLLTKSDGTKFGKSEGGAIYLDPSITHPYVMYQFLINQNDDDVKKLLLALTFLSVEEIEQIASEHKKNKALRIAQKKLAFEIVKDIHGEDICQKCISISNAFFSNQLHKLQSEDLFLALNNMPTTILKQESINIVDFLVTAKIAESKSKARTLILSNAISVNNVLIDSLDFNISKKNAINGKFAYLRKGKKNYFLINWDIK